MPTKSVASVSSFHFVFSDENSIIRTNPATKSASVGDPSLLSSLSEIFHCSNYSQQPKTKDAGYCLIIRRTACLAIRITFLRTLGCFMEDSMIYRGGVAGYEAGGVRRGLRRVLTRGRRRAIGRLGIDRATSSKRPARASQPPPTLISNHPTPRYLSEFSGQGWSH